MNIALRTCSVRHWHPDDAPALQRHANNRAIARNLRDIFPHPYHLDHAHTFIGHVLRQTPLTTFAITSQTEAIGCIGVTLGTDVSRRTAELGYWLAEPFWRKGIMTEVLRTFVPWAFTEFNLARIQAEVFARNLPSARLLEKVGFTCEGRLRAHICKDGVLQDALLYARLREGNDHLG